MKVSVVTVEGEGSREHVHAADCRDLKTKKYAGLDVWNLEAESKRGLIEELHGDDEDSDLEAGDWIAYGNRWMVFYPCAGLED